MGVGGSLWAQRKMKAVAARYSPSGLAGGAAERAKVLPGEVKAALEGGRHAMRVREAELRARTRGRRLTPVSPRGDEPGRP